MQVARLKAESRSALGRNQLRQLRSQGWMPAIVYGEGKEPEPIAISEWELDQHIKHHHRVFQLEYGGGQQAAYLQEVKLEAISDRIQHADFKRIDLSKPIELEVEVAFTGHPKGLGQGGVLIKDHPKIRVRCLPTSIPEDLPVTITQLELDESLLAKDVPLPAGVTLAVQPELVVCHVAKLVVQVVEAPTPAAEAVPAEGAAPAAGAAGAPAAGAAPAKDAAAPPAKDAGKKKE
jgi:large subunit ribosomal protein L25